MPEIFELTLADSRTVYTPGDVLTVRADWSLSKPPHEIEAHLLFYTSGKGTEDTQLIDSRSIPNPQVSGQDSLQFELPLYPYSFSGHLISVIWCVELTAKPGGHVARVDFTLSPYDSEIRLEKLPDDNKLKKMLGRQ